MNKILYLANSFPEASEPYVWAEIAELRKRGRTVVPCSFRRPKHVPTQVEEFASETFYVFPLRMQIVLRTCWMCISQMGKISDLFWRLIRGPETMARRFRALAHTWLGVYLAAALGKEPINHIHVHHGYFSSWAGMTAARLLDAGFSLTLHGSDLLVCADYLDCKLENCQFCVTVSEFNRDHICSHYPVSAGKILVHRLGVELEFWRPLPKSEDDRNFCVLAVGRLHAIKNHEFLIRACLELKNAGLLFRCIIAGEGQERKRLQTLVRQLGLRDHVQLPSHVARERLPQLYSQADVVVLTSNSEGIPQALMEAMAMERVVLAPAITGIPELITDASTGFLYQQHSMPEFLQKLVYIAATKPSLDRLRRNARRHIDSHFNRQRNLNTWADDFIQQLKTPASEQERSHAHPLLQQVQLPIQRDRSLPV
jgi:colanic acid/amylovoran biosynthesis glycosyltransferase